MLAAFTTSKTRDQIQEELAKMVGARSGTRIYIVARRPHRVPGGKFVPGSRKQAPWARYAARATPAEEKAWSGFALTRVFLNLLRPRSHRPNAV